MTTTITPDQDASPEAVQATTGHAVEVDLGRYDQGWFDRGRGPIACMLWDMVQTLLIAPSPHCFYSWRRFWYRLFGATIGKDVLIRKSVKCNYPWKLTIGDRCWIGDGATLYTLDHITLDSDVVVSQQAYLCTGSHDPSDPAFGLRTAPITVRRGAWIALGAVVMPGATIGNGALIGARAVLTHDAAARTIYTGSPARERGRREIVEREVDDEPV
ncbi:MAG: WcaF family extracellular polysaccharide biosynthesis acetyltransferase [Planctomycetota bacterium]